METLARLTPSLLNAARGVIVIEFWLAVGAFLVITLNY